MNTNNLVEIPHPDFENMEMESTRLPNGDIKIKYTVRQHPTIKRFLRVKEAIKIVNGDKN